MYRLTTGRLIDHASEQTAEYVIDIEVAVTVRFGLDELGNVVPGTQLASLQAKTVGCRRHALVGVGDAAITGVEPIQAISGNTLSTTGDMARVSVDMVDYYPGRVEGGWDVSLSNGNDLSTVNRRYPRRSSPTPSPVRTEYRAATELQATPVEAPPEARKLVTAAAHPKRPSIVL